MTGAGRRFLCLHATALRRARELRHQIARPSLLDSPVLRYLRADLVRALDDAADWRRHFSIAVRQPLPGWYLAALSAPPPRPTRRHHADR